MKLFCNSLPKSGTNLLIKYIENFGIQYSGNSLASSSIYGGRYDLLKYVLRYHSFSRFTKTNIGLDFSTSINYKSLTNTFRVNNNTYVTGHSALTDKLYYVLRKNNFKVIIIKRDLNSVSRSWAEYLLRNSNSWAFGHKALLNKCSHKIESLLLNGFPLNNSGSKYYEGIYSMSHNLDFWKNKKNVIYIKFEDLIGVEGGGNEFKRIETIERISKFLYPDKDFIYSKEKWGNHLFFGNSKTFRLGKVS